MLGVLDIVQGSYSQRSAGWQMPSTQQWRWFRCDLSGRNSGRAVFGRLASIPPALQSAFGVAGSESSNADPAPSLERTAIPPPRSMANRFEMYSPSPAP